MNSYFVVRATIFIFCFIATIISGQRLNTEQAICDRYNQPTFIWKCTRIPDCKWSHQLLNSNQEYRCGSDRRVTKICCPERKSTPKPTSTTSNPQRKDYIRIIRQKCADYSAFRYFNVCVGGLVFGQTEKCEKKLDCVEKVESLIVGGISAAPKQFPHMALVGFGEQITNIDWACGGSLISERFVLSAAHCTNLDYAGQVKWVAMGIRFRKEATAEKLNKNIFRIAKAFNHPSYKPPLANHDIALYELQKPVTFTPYIRPICLHTHYDIPKDATDKGSITGWGITDAGEDLSDDLLTATISFIPNQSCLSAYANEKKLRDGFDAKTMVCAGNEYNRKDTCTGDSGGPLQIAQGEKCMHAQVGITSIGSSFCGDYTPAIYTRVSFYLEWIQKIVWPNGV